MKFLVAFLWIAACAWVNAQPKQVRVFVALCDNKTQGIAPVGEKIGDGDKPDANLYWGCSDGFGSYFARSRHWNVLSKKRDVSESILRRMTLRHSSKNIEIIADAYRGSEIRKCLNDFEAAASQDKYDLVAFIGHNGLMDFKLLPPESVEGNDTDVIVLCCLSEKYFGERLKLLGCRPILMTRQLMYPGSFLLHEAIENWHAGQPLDKVRAAAGRAYAKNQKISVRAATGIFSRLKVK